MRPSSRWLLVGPAAVLAGVLAAGALARPEPAQPVPAVAQDRPGPVLLVPGYGGSTTGLTALAGTLMAEGREVSIVGSVGDGTGDLEDAALLLRATADRFLADGAPSVDVVGYSAGGVVARLWAAQGGAAQARRIVTLGSPHHGTRVAALGAVFAAGACPPACQQLVPGSPLLDRLNEGDETPDGPQWVALWTRDDTVVTPAESARLEGAVDVVVQDLCPGTRLDHGQLPRDPTVQRIVLQALSTADPAPGPELCAPAQ